MSPLSFAEALESAARLATQALPATLHARIADAVVLVRDGHCFQDDAGTWSVQSASDPAQVYSHVNGACPCEDVHFNQPERGLCKHRLAVYLSRKVAALMTVARTGSPEPTPDQGYLRNLETCASHVIDVTKTQPLGEAPASVNCHITIDGRQVQLTLRDRDEGRLLERLQVVLAQYPAPQPSAQAPASTQAEGWCGKHGVQMKRHENAGGVWYSHYVEGRHCKGK